MGMFADRNLCFLFYMPRVPLEKQRSGCLLYLFEACSQMSVFNAAPPRLDDLRSLINLAGDTLQVPVSTKNAKALFLQDLGY